MKTLRNLFLTLVILLSVFTLTSCKAKEKTFSSNGITVTLTSKFKEKTIQGAQVVYMSRKVGFMGNPEAKSLLMLPDGVLAEYTEKVIEVSNLKDIETKTFEENGNTFMYGYYKATVKNITYKYMLVTKEGENHYYTMNFWTVEKDFATYEDQMMEWAKSIVVE